MSTEIEFTKDNLDRYLKELAKEFRRLNGKTTPAEIVLIGGAAILANYGFREMTYDIDAVIRASSAMREAINHVGDALGLPNGWLNADFMKTSSYTPKLIEHSVYYKTYSNVLTIRSVAAEYLIAMKLMSGRRYKNDLSDVIGILREHEKKNEPIGFESIDRAMRELYGGWERAPKDSKSFIEDVIEYADYEKLYQEYRKEEKSSKEVLLEFNDEYPGVTKADNIDEVLKIAKARKKNKEGDAR